MKTPTYSTYNVDSVTNRSISLRQLCGRPNVSQLKMMKKKKKMKIGLNHTTSTSAAAISSPRRMMITKMKNYNWLPKKYTKSWMALTPRRTAIYAP